MRFLSSLFLALLLTVGPTASAAEARRLNVVDYLLLLPAKTFEAPAKEWATLMRLPKYGTYDPANGYLSCVGDGAQPPFEVTLFRYQDDRPLLAVC